MAERHVCRIDQVLNQDLITVLHITRVVRYGEVVSDACMVTIHVTCRTEALETLRLFR